jgi:hypothetical protein
MPLTVPYMGFAASIKWCMDPSFSNSYSLLFHNFMYSYTILVVHFVKFIKCRQHLNQQEPLPQVLAFFLLTLWCCQLLNQYSNKSFVKLFNTTTSQWYVKIKILSIKLPYNRFVLVKRTTFRAPNSRSKQTVRNTLMPPTYQTKKNARTFLEWETWPIDDRWQIKGEFVLDFFENRFCSVT